jgi:hypothetical protein
MEDRIRVRSRDQGQGRACSNHVVEFLIVDMERLGKQRLLGYSRPNEYLRVVQHSITQRMDGKGWM